MKLFFIDQRATFVYRQELAWCESVVFVFDDICYVYHTYIVAYFRLFVNSIMALYPCSLDMLNRLSGILLLVVLNFNEDTIEPRYRPSMRLRIMKRIFSSVLAITIIAAPSSALAQPLSPDINSIFKLQPALIEKTVPLPIKVVEPAPEPKPAEPVVYTVLPGDNLSKIGTTHNVEWQRLWAKNTQLTNPDVIKPGDKITVPLADEQLQRDLPAVVTLPAVTPNVVAPTPEARSGDFGGGNTYDYGYCTWYVKNRRGSSLPNGLGNANMWYYNAQRTGMAVGSTPVAGAVGTTTRGELGHVVYVESVNADGSIMISEMNAPVFGKRTDRRANASEFLYIY